MPFIQILSSVEELSPESREALHDDCTEVLSKVLQKSKRYIMSRIEVSKDLSFAEDSQTPSAYIEIKNIGTLSPDLTKQLSAQISDLAERHLGIQAGRVYIEFQISERHLWGWNGKTFAN